MWQTDQLLAQQENFMHVLVEVYEKNFWLEDTSASLPTKPCDVHYILETEITSVTAYKEV